MTKGLNEDVVYRLGGGLPRAPIDSPYEVPTNEPRNWRPLRVYALDPSVSRLEGAVATVTIPVEKDLKRGPSGRLFNVDMSVDGMTTVYEPLLLDDPATLRTDGLHPDPAAAGFHAQMVYAIACLTYESFRKALGRHTSWAFDGADGRSIAPLNLYPFGLQKERNARYSRSEHSVRFGFFRSEEDNLARIPGTFLFTSLSSDIVTHEVAHALLDGLRPYFSEPTHPEVPAFHEAFADLIAVFQRFTFEELVCAQMKKAKGRLDGQTLLRVLAPEFGIELGRQGGLRTFEPALSRALKERDATETSPPSPVGIADLSEEDRNKPHKLGRILAEAIFDAFATIVHRKTAPVIGLATQGSGVLPEGAIAPALLDEIVHVTRRVAEQFRTICIRAIDYCPPVHVEFGDYIRALITADRALVRKDPHGYREAIVKAALMRGIYPRHVPTPSETSLMWHGPEHAVDPIEGLDLSSLNFKGDPAIPADRGELKRQARILGEALATSPKLLHECGLNLPGEGYGLIEIVSIRSSRRVGPDGQVGFDLIAEIVQSREITVEDHRILVRGGATIIFNAEGAIRYVIRKRVDNEDRRAEIERFLRSDGGRRYLPVLAGGEDLFRTLCLDETKPHTPK